MEITIADIEKLAEALAETYDLSLADAHELIDLAERVWRSFEPTVESLDLFEHSWICRETDPFWDSPEEFAVFEASETGVEIPYGEEMNWLIASCCYSVRQLSNGRWAAFSHYEETRTGVFAA